MALGRCFAASNETDNSKSSESGNRTMTDRDLPVTPDELHAYVDGVLPADRLGAVEAWLPTHRDDAARVAEWRAQANAIRSHYDIATAEPLPDRFDLERLTRKGRVWRGIAAAAVVMAFGIGGIIGWMAHSASAAPEAKPTNFEIFSTEALDAHKLYVVEVRHPVEVSGDERTHLVQWLSKRLDYELRVPDLEPAGLKLVGGRLLPGPSGPSAFFMYEAASGERYTIYCAHSSSPESGMRYRESEPFSSFYWVDHGLGYVVSGPNDRKRLWGVVKAAYDQIDKSETPKTSG
jgi:anti-sigma factor RsiW